jgi:hypothetical protein
MFPRITLASDIVVVVIFYQTAFAQSASTKNDASSARQWKVEIQKNG